MQWQCKPNAIEYFRIAEVQPVLARAKVRWKTTHSKYSSSFFLNYLRHSLILATKLANVHNLCRKSLAILYFPWKYFVVSKIFYTFVAKNWRIMPVDKQVNGTAIFHSSRRKDEARTSASVSLYRHQLQSASDTYERQGAQQDSRCHKCTQALRWRAHVWVSSQKSPW